VSRRHWTGYRTGRPLPPVAPLVDDDGRVYYTEYSWQEQACGRTGPPWLTGGMKACSGKPNCGCSSFERKARRMGAPYPRIDDMRRAGLILAGELDDQIPPREALRRIRRYLPHIRTANQLFLATAWQPFKLVFERGWVGYTNFGLILWARARAAGQRAPWEAAPRRSIARAA
jgi:hypothetical protein